MSILKALNNRPIAYYPIYRDITGSTVSGILLSQLMYWFSKKDVFYKTDIDILEETRLTVNELRGAKSKLKKLDFIKIDRRGVPAKTFYTIDWELYESSLVKFTNQSKLEELNKISEINETIEISEINETNTKTNTKSSTKTTLRPEKKNFNSFREDFKMIHTKEQFYTKGLGWLSDTPFIIKNDLIFNTVSNKTLNKEEAFIVWEYLFNESTLAS